MTRFIAVAGNIGAGKTSLVEFLSVKHGFRAIYEPHRDNPYLDDFYADMGSWAFQSQLYFLTHKFRLHLDLDANRTETIVLDRTIYEDAEIFARNLADTHMSARDYALYRDLYEAMRRALRPPDLLIYLRCSVKAIRRRIKVRGRPSEQAIPTAYLTRLNALYEDWLSRYDQSPVLIWDSEHKDYLTNLIDRLEFRQRLAELIP